MGPRILELGTKPSQLHIPTALTPGRELPLLIGEKKWVGSSASLDVVARKRSLHPPPPTGNLISLSEMRFSLRLISR
jgi:hypothetical protein